MNKYETEEKFKPGTFGCHEALHVAFLVANLVDDDLCEHPAIKLNRAWKKKADKAAEILFDLYQDIGKEHIK